MKIVVIILVSILTFLAYREVDAQEKNNDKLRNECKHDSLQNKSKRFSNITEAGYMFGFGNALLTTGGITMGGAQTQFVKYKNENNLISFTTINGCEFHRNTFLGIGLGAEIGENKINLPIFIDGRIYFFNKKVGPIFYKKVTSGIDLSAGYAFNWMESSLQLVYKARSSVMFDLYSFPKSNNKGGAIASAQIGIRVYIYKNFSWIFGLGYRFQHIRFLTTFTDSQGQQFSPDFFTNELTHFFTLKTGITF
jgi:hypothetical protein